MPIPARRRSRRIVEQATIAGGSARQAELERTADQLFMIVGCSRSGTSLMQAMISSHPDVAMPPETAYFSTIAPMLRKLDLRTDDGLAGAVDTVLSFHRIAPLGLDRSAVLELARAGDPSAETIFLAMLATFATQHLAARVGEKSPRHFRNLDHLAGAYPKGRFIHMIRDPRAVILSNRKNKFASHRLGRNIEAWRNAIRAHERSIRTIDARRYLAVHYESLVTETESTLRRVCEHIDLRFDPRMLEHHRRSDPGFLDSQQKHMANTMRPVFTSSIEKWREELSHEQIALIEHRLAGTMKSLGYEPTGARTRLAGLKLALSRTAWRFDLVMRVLRGRR